MDADQIRAAEMQEAAERMHEAEEAAKAKEEKAAKKQAKLDEKKQKGFIKPSELDTDSYSDDDDEDENSEEINWSKFAYVQYATDSDYLCNTVMMFEALHRLGAMADRVLMYPSNMLRDPLANAAKSADGELIIKARDLYGAKLAPIEIQHRYSGEGRR